MFQHWFQDRRETAESQRHLAYLIGSFIDPERVRRLLDAEANTYASDDEEFNTLSQQIHDLNAKKDSEAQSGPRRRRKKKYSK